MSPCKLEESDVVREVARKLAPEFVGFFSLETIERSAAEGYAFNRRIVQFVVDPEGVAAGAGWTEYRDLWQAVVDSVECVTDKEVTHA